MREKQIIQLRIDGYNNYLNYIRKELILAPFFMLFLGVQINNKGYFLFLFLSRFAAVVGM